ncbi:MAG TPA: aminopeptidase [Rhodanobacteraceae bacterium]|nr:aminopeptidase [Rhodanobacteraceae bacterium]
MTAGTHANKPAAVRLLVAACAFGLLGGCSTLGYYAHLATGEAAVLRARQPIPRVIDDPATPPALRTRLQLALRARTFASDVLHLPRNQSYTTYADIHRPFVMWNVFATPALSVHAIEHCFPFAGCVAYQGFYRHARAEARAREFATRGDDVWVGGVPAYSTLGHFADPLLSTMNRWSDDELVATIFHELAHQEYYLKGDTEFNESYATFVQREGLRQWLAANHLPPPDPVMARREREFTQLVLATRAQLEALYASHASDADKLAGKTRIFAQLRQRYAHLRDTEWHGYTGYDHWFATPLSNAKLVPFGLYDRGVPAFAALFKRCDGNWRRFYQAVRHLGGESAAARAAFLAGTNTAP